MQLRRTRPAAQGSLRYGAGRVEPLRALFASLRLGALSTHGLRCFDGAIVALRQSDCQPARPRGQLLNVLGREAETPTWPESVWAEVCRTLARKSGIANSDVTEREPGRVSLGGARAASAGRARNVPRG